MTTTNEMDGATYNPLAQSDDIEITIPSSAVTTDDASATVVDINKDDDITNPVRNTDVRPELVFVYTNTITPVASTPESALVYFDVIFSVSITDESNDQISTHQVVKRIGIDKMKMANEAKLTTPTVLESKAPVEQKPSLISASKDRLKALAGLK